METLPFLSRVILLNVLLILCNSEGILAQGPSFTSCPPDRTYAVNVGVKTRAVTWATPLTTGGTGQLTVTSNIQPGVSFKVGMTTVTYSVVDEQGRSDTCSFTITITAPMIYGCPDLPVTQNNAPGQSYADVTWTAPTIQNPSASSSLTSDRTNGGRFQIGDTNVTYTLTDAGSNTETCVFIVRVEDVDAPTFNTCPSDIMTRVLAESACDITQSWANPTATDNGGVPTVSGSHQPGSSLFGCGTSQVTFTATDSFGNIGYCRFNVTLIVGAYVNCPSNIMGITAPGSNMGVATWIPPTILDRHSDWTQTTSHNPGARFLAGMTTVSYRLEDTAEAADTCQFTVTIIDPEPPTIVCPGKIVLTATNPVFGANVMWSQPSTSDNVAIHHTWSNYQSGDMIPIGDTVIIYGTNDTSGHTAYCNFTITVRDYVLSIFTQLNNHVFFGNDDIIMNASSIVECLNACVDETTFRCRSAEYTSQGECRLSQNIARLDSQIQPQVGVIYFERLGDNTPPTISACSNDIEVIANRGQNFTTTFWLPPMATDDQGGPVSWASTHQSGDTFYIGATQVVYTAIDEFLNKATCTFTVTVLDNEAPLIQNCPGRTIAYLYRPEQRGIAVSWIEPTAQDNSGQVTLHTTHLTGGTYPRGNTEVIYRAHDPSNNEAFCEFTVSVIYISAGSRIEMQILVPNLAYTPSFADRDSHHFGLIDSELRARVQEAFGTDSTFLDSKLINITMAQQGGVEILLSLGFSQSTSYGDKLEEFTVIYNSLMTNGIAGAGVDQIFALGNDGNMIVVDRCSLLPCPNGMNCTVEDDVCVSACSYNPTYCLNDGWCVQPNDDLLVSCLCSSYMYFGTRCDLQDTVNEPRTLAIIIGVVWLFIFLLLVILCFPLLIRRCLKKPKRKRHGSDEDLVKETFSFSDDDDDIDIETKAPPKKKSLDHDPTQNGSHVNPAFVDDEKELLSNAEPIFNGNGLELKIEDQGTMHTDNGPNGAILNVDASRSQGDGKSNFSDDTNEAIDMRIISDSPDLTLTVEGDAETDMGIDAYGQHSIAADVHSSGEYPIQSSLSSIAEEEEEDYPVPTSEARVGPDEVYVPVDVPDVSFAGPSVDVSGQNLVSGAVPGTGDHNFTVRTSHGLVLEEGSEADSESSSLHSERPPYRQPEVNAMAGVY